MKIETLERFVGILLIISLGVFVLMLYGNLTGLLIFWENIEFPHFSGVGIFAIFLIFFYFMIKLFKKK